MTLHTCTAIMISKAWCIYPSPPERQYSRLQPNRRGTQPWARLWMKHIRRSAGYGGSETMELYLNTKSPKVKEAMASCIPWLSITVDFGLIVREPLPTSQDVSVFQRQCQRSASCNDPRWHGERTTAYEYSYSVEVLLFLFGHGNRIPPCKPRSRASDWVLRLKKKKTLNYRVNRSIIRSLTFTADDVGCFAIHSQPSTE